MTGKSSTSWRCVVCGYIHHGDAPPDLCPVCAVGPESFEPVEEATSAPSAAGAATAQAEVETTAGGS